jgi:HSP20 family protein
MSQHWNPLRDLVVLQERMNRLFEDATERHSREGTETGEESDMERADWAPSADVYERETEYVVVLDLPGIDRSSLDISIDKDRLFIRGKRDVDSENRRRAERPHGRFSRKFTLPSHVDQASISAEYKDGELRVTLPRRKQQESKRIEIKVS